MTEPHKIVQIAIKREFCPNESRNYVDAKFHLQMDERAALKPFKDTIDKAATKLAELSKEAELCTDRLDALNNQMQGLEDLMEQADIEATKTVSKFDAENAALDRQFLADFATLAVNEEVDGVLDPAREFTIDPHYFESFGVIYVCELTENSTDLVQDDDDADFGSWVNDIEADGDNK